MSCKLSVVGILDRAKQIFGWSSTIGFQQSANLSSPFATGTGLAPVIASDLGYYSNGGRATALEALSCPPIFRGLAVLTTLIGDLRLMYEDGTELSAADAWMNESPGSITPGQRHAALLLDLVLERDSVYWVERDGDAITSALKLPRECWQLDWLGNVVINGEPAKDQSQFIYFQSLMPLGLLDAAASSIEHYIDLRNTIRSRSKNPMPLVELHVTQEFEGTAQELQDTQDRWAKARQAENGAVAITPLGVQVIIHRPEDGGAMLTEARNANRLDFANFLNLAASLLEGANGSSGTYENTLQSKDELVTLSLLSFLAPIQQRYSQPDVTRSGKRIVFDVRGLSAAPESARGNVGTAIAGELVGSPQTSSSPAEAENP